MCRATASGPWLCAGLAAAVGCSWSVTVGGPGAGGGAPAAQGLSRPRHGCDTDTSLFQILAHTEPQLSQWSTEDVWAADAAGESAPLLELARSLPAGVPEGPPRLAEAAARTGAVGPTTAIGVAAAAVGVLLVFVLCLFANKVAQSSASDRPEQPKDKKGVSKTMTMQSSVSIRSERSMHSATSSNRRAGKTLSDKLLGRRRASESYQPRARMFASGAEPRMVAQDTTCAGWTQASSSVVQHVSSQRMAGMPNSSGNISVGGMSAATEGSAFAVGTAAAQQGQGPGGYVPGECRFTVPVDMLVEAAEEGTFTIADVASGLLLRVGIDNKASARSLRVFVGKDSPNPCTTVSPTSGGSMQAGSSMEIRGANGLHFGMLALQPNGSFLVTTAEQQPLLTIEGNEANLDLRISARDGRLVASVSCSESADPSKGVEHVEFRVLPGTDPVLVVSCILSVLLLGGDDEDDY